MVNGSIKSHSRWFSQRGAYPLKDRAPDRLERHWNECLQMPEGGGAHWECLGPFNIAGRATCLVCHPADSNLLFAGSANGGVWRSKNGGEDWEWTWIRWTTPAIGSLAFDPFDANCLYAGTGEANGSTDAYPGCGVYVSKDLGESWQLAASAHDLGLPARIGALVPNPSKRGEIWLGGVTHEESMPAGLFYSRDGGSSWERENFFSAKPYSCHSIAFHTDGSVFAAIESGGVQSGLWHYSQGAWTQLRGGLPPGDRLGRISVVAATKAPYPVYCMVASPSGRGLAGIFRSVAPFHAWTNIIGESQIADEGFFGYNNSLAVHPEDPDTLYAGATNLHVTRDAGQNWTALTMRMGENDDPKYVHADHHAIVIPRPGLIYSANDGGVACSTDDGSTWKMRVRNLCTTMFYDMDVSPQDHQVFGGGAQDNGCLLAGIGAGYLRVLGGDGSAIVFDPKRAAHAYAARTDVHFVRHNNAQFWGPHSWHEASPEMDDAERKQNPFTIAAIDPENPDTVWTGSGRMWRTVDGGLKWLPKSHVFDGSGITAIEVAGKMIYAGTAKGGLFRSFDGGETWGGDISGPEIPARMITRIETHPEDSHRLVVSLAGTDLAPVAGVKVGPYLSAGREDICHLYHSQDAGTSWKGIAGNLPNVAFHAVVYERQLPYTLYVANDCGVWSSADFEHWTDITGDMPNVMVSDLVLHHQTRLLYAATYGRGIWRLALPA